MENVKCFNCGYLAMRNRKTRELSEVEYEIRKSGVSPNGPIEHRDPTSLIHIGTPIYQRSPICFCAEPGFVSEVGNSAEGTMTDELFLEIINRDRQCDKFIKWNHGMSPKEHRQMDIYERAEAMANAAEKRREELDRSAHRTHMVEVIVVGVLGTIGIIFQFLTAVQMWKPTPTSNSTIVAPPVTPKTP